MRASTLPTSVFAAPEDWGAAELGERVRRAASELALVIQGRIEQGIADRARSGPFSRVSRHAARHFVYVPRNDARIRQKYRLAA